MDSLTNADPNLTGKNGSTTTGTNADAQTSDQGPPAQLNQMLDNNHDADELSTNGYSDSHAPSHLESAFAGLSVDGMLLSQQQQQHQLQQLQQLHQQQQLPPVIDDYGALTPDSSSLPRDAVSYMSMAQMAQAPAGFQAPTAMFSPYPVQSMLAGTPDMLLMAPNLYGATSAGTQPQYQYPYQYQYQYRNYLNTFTVSISDLPVNCQWKNVKDLAQSQVPSAHIIYTKMTGPGTCLLSIKGYTEAVTCAQLLDGLTLDDGSVLKASLLANQMVRPGPAPAPTSMTADGSPLISTPILYTPTLAGYSAGTNGSAAGATPGYPMVYDPNVAAYGAPAAWSNPYKAQYGGFYQQPTQHHYNTHNKRRHNNTPRFRANGVERQRLYIGNLPFHTQWQDLKDFLRAGGNIFRVEIPESDNGQPKGYAIATFFTEEDAESALKMFDRAVFNGRELVVRYDRGKYKGPGQGWNKTNESEDQHDDDNVDNVGEPNEQQLDQATPNEIVDKDGAQDLEVKDDLQAEPAAEPIATSGSKDSSLESQNGSAA